MNDQTPVTDSPLAVSLRIKARASVDTLRERLVGTGITKTPQACMRTILAYMLFLQRIDRLFAIITEAAGSSKAVHNIELVRQIELGWTGEGTSHADLFAEAAAPFYEAQIHVSEEPDLVPTDAAGMREKALENFEQATRDDVLRPGYWNNVEHLLRAAMNQPAIGFVAYYFVYLAYAEILKDELAAMFRATGYDPDNLRYFSANEPEELERCLVLMLEGFVYEATCPASTFSAVSINRVINLTDKFLTDMFVDESAAGRAIPATASRAYAAAH